MKAASDVIDPTENVKALSAADNKRQDDLRMASDRYVEMNLKWMEKLANERAEHQKELRISEKQRIDAIRAVDVNAVAVANEKQSAAATILANQVSQTAETLRALVSTTAAANAEQQRISFSQIDTRLKSLEQSQSEIKGKGSITEPQFAELLAEVKAQRGTKHEGLSVAWQILLGLVAMGGFIWALVK